MLRDAEFGPVRLRAFGTYAVKVVEADKFIREIAGTQAHFTTEEVTEQLRNLIVTRFTDAVGESKIPVLDLAANYDELSKFISGKLAPEFNEYGLTITKFLVENISLPAEVEAMLDKRSGMGIVGNLNQYAQFQAANAMEQAAKNPSGGTASEGIGLGMGFAMANQMGQMFNQGNQPGQPTSGPPQVPGVTQYYIVVSGQQNGPHTPDGLKDLITKGVLTRDTLVWKQGMQSWIKAGDAPEISTLFGSSPPPIPQ
jgi:membrane protease subunit (stomatin/prohibitin family)